MLNNELLLMGSGNPYLYVLTVGEDSYSGGIYGRGKPLSGSYPEYGEISPTNFLGMTIGTLSVNHGSPKDELITILGFSDSYDFSNTDPNVKPCSSVVFTRLDNGESVELPWEPIGYTDEDTNVTDYEPRFATKDTTKRIITANDVGKQIPITLVPVF